MRFYTKVENWVEETFHEIIHEPWNVFATDLLYFLACEYETGWIPYKVLAEFDNGIIIPTPRHIYTPHPLSPFTNNMRRSVKYGVLPSDPVFEETYRIIVQGPDGQENKLALFVDHIQEAFDDFFGVERNMRDMLMMLLYVGKMATIFYKHGTKDAPQFALTLMAHGLLKLGSKVPLNQAFDGMDAFATVCCMKMPNYPSVSPKVPSGKAFRAMKVSVNVCYMVFHQHNDEDSLIPATFMVSYWSVYHFYGATDVSQFILTLMAAAQLKMDMKIAVAAKRLKQ